MFIFTDTPCQLAKKQWRIDGGGLFEWIPNLSSVTNAMGSAGNFFSTNKDMIKNTADVIGNVAKVGATTASAVKQIVDAVKAKRAAVGTTKELVKQLSEKSLDFLQHLACAETSGTSTVPTSINSQIAGAGFKTIKP